MQNFCILTQFHENEYQLGINLYTSGNSSAVAGVIDKLLKEECLKQAKYCFTHYSCWFDEPWIVTKDSSTLKDIIATNNYTEYKIC